MFLKFEFTLFVCLVNTTESRCKTTSTISKFAVNTSVCGRMWSSDSEWTSNYGEWMFLDFQIITIGKFRNNKVNICLIRLGKWNFCSAVFNVTHSISGVNSGNIVTI